MDDKSKDPNRRFVLKYFTIPKTSGFVNFRRARGTPVSEGTGLYLSVIF
jgi:hypothetical protein